MFADTNPHTIAFYKALQDQKITPAIIKDFLQTEGTTLSRVGEAHYYAIRERFNREAAPLDFLFLNRACFNGVMRFNRKGGFNVPCCRKPDRFAQAYITKIVNQATAVYEHIHCSQWEFKVQQFTETIATSTPNDFIYADPPYVGRHLNYFESWDEIKEAKLFQSLSQGKARFILSTWEENTYRRNSFIDGLWGCFPRVSQQHFYHVGAP